jgi:micrococcal nuclease
MLPRGLMVAATICCAVTAAYAAAKTPITERVTAIQSDGTITLSSSGKAVLSNLFYPDAALAERWLAQYLLQQDIAFKAGDEDRYGRVQITSDTVQNMLRDGAAVFYVSDGKISEVWKAAEAQARTANRGVWADKNLLRTPENAAQHIGAFHVVEGTITRIYEAKSATYLNFGDDWHSDFSITIPGKIRRSMKPFLASVKPGDRIRVRGFITDENGPMITLLRPDNLEMR